MMATGSSVYISNNLNDAGISLSFFSFFDILLLLLIVLILFKNSERKYINNLNFG